MSTRIRKIFVTAAVAAAVLGVEAQEQFSFKFYGRIRTDMYYNSRANNENVDGLFYLYPKDHNYDADGRDLNATPNGYMYSIYTRLGVNIKGPDIGNAKTSGCVEMDFRGTGSTYSVPRLRHAYFNLDFGPSSWLVGQTWHPMFGEVSPSIVNLCSGAPYQPFNRSPQIRYRYHINSGLTITAASIWQMQFCSMGPDGKSHNYLKNSCVPELFVGVDFANLGWLVGLGGELLSLKPRLQSTVDGKVYKVDERVTSISVEGHVKYTGRNYFVAAKTALANNLTQASTLGGFAVTSIDERTGECKYTPFRHSITWVNAVWGKKWQPGVFLGYLKNLGTGHPIAGVTYGVGLDVDQLASANVQLTYNLPHWKIGGELSRATAWYGKTDLSDGRVVDTHSVTNYRIALTVMYIF